MSERSDNARRASQDRLKEAKKLVEAVKESVKKTPGSTKAGHKK